MGKASRRQQQRRIDRERTYAVTDAGIIYQANGRSKVEHYLEARKPDEHLIVATAAFVISAESALRTFIGAEQSLLDQENLLDIQMGCYLCEQPYSIQLMNTPCPGDVSGHLAE